MSDYPSMSTYAISNYFANKSALDNVVKEVESIREQCFLAWACRGDLSGRVYGWVYHGEEQAEKLLSEFEIKAKDYLESIDELKNELPQADFEFLTRYGTSVDFGRKCIEGYTKEIKEYFNLTHENYKTTPPPEKKKPATATSAFFNLAAYLSLIYTVYHFIF